MPIGYKFAKRVVPFPTGDGIWARIITKGDVITRAEFLLFEGNRVVEMVRGNVATPEIVLEGDRVTQADGGLPTYTCLEGVQVLRPAENKNGEIMPKSDNAV